MLTIEHSRFQSSGAARPPRLGLLLIDDHAILRDGLRALLESERDLQIIGEAGNVATGVSLAIQLQPDVVITDISFPEGGGMEAIGRLRRECPNARIVVLTVHNTLECYRATLKAGAHEFVVKDTPYEILLAAIRSALAWQDKTVQSQPSASVRGDLKVRQHISPASQLTFRERQVLVGVAQGYTSKEIAAKLNRSVKTIVKHRSNMMRKLSLHDASAVTRFAIVNGLLSP
jgi:two-component system, NarL family, response regulator NreC